MTQGLSSGGKSLLVDHIWVNKDGQDVKDGVLVVWV